MDSTIAHFSDGSGMGFGLFAIAQDRQPAGVFACQCIGSYGAGCRGSNSRDLASMGHANRGARVGIEENDQALMRLHPFGEVVVEDADQFRAEYGVGSHGAGHDSEETPFGQRDDRSQKLAGLAFREGDHGIAHDGDTNLVGKPPGDFFAVNESHNVGVPKGIRTPVIAVKGRCPRPG